LASAGVSGSPVTDRPRRFVSLVGTAALGIVVYFGLTISSTKPPEWWYAGILILLVVVATGSSVKIRIRSNMWILQWAEAAILVGIAVLPPPWIVLCTIVGTGVVYALMQVQPIKLAFNTAKATVAVAAAIPVANLTGFGWTPGEEAVLFSASDIYGLILVAAVLFAVGETLTTVVLALATGTQVRELLTSNPSVRIAALLSNTAIGGATLALLTINRLLLVAVPPLVLCLHLFNSGRLRAQSERETWQRLAEATDRFNDVDLNAVLHAAVTTSAELFSADQTEVEVRLPDTEPLLVRGDAQHIAWNGPLHKAPEARTASIDVPLASHDNSIALGHLRLRFHGRVRLSERERYALRTFAASLCTALRNAQTHAQTRRMALQHERLAQQDPLTGLANRRRLLELGERAVSTRPIRGIHALLLIDLDHFKEINDTLGHGMGDSVLRMVAQRLEAAVAGTKDAGTRDVVARLGGDEFAIMFVGLPAPALASHRARKVLAALDPPFEVDGIRLQVEASGGVATAPAEGGMTELLRRADVAMYQAKRAGHTVAIYNQSRDTADLGQLALSGDLRKALDERQFALGFQPIVDLASGQVLAAEALARWRHPRRGDLGPPRFLEAIVRSGLLTPFTEIVLDGALSAAQSWHDIGHPIPVTVNVSARSLLDSRFPELVERQLALHDVPRDHVVLELTETLTLSRLDVVEEVLAALREAGVQLALDDFGTGYGSLSTLAEVPIQQLKIDRKFIAAMESSNEAVAVVRSTIELGRSLDLAVVAVGVESERQRQTLFELGCPAGQGHLFSRPMTAERLTGVLRRGGDLAPPLSAEAAVIRMPASRTRRRNIR